MLGQIKTSAQHSAQLATCCSAKVGPRRNIGSMSYEQNWGSCSVRLKLLRSTRRSTRRSLRLAARQKLVIGGTLARGATRAVARSDKNRLLG